MKSEYKFIPFKKFLAEFLGTFVLVLVSKGAAISINSGDSSASLKNLSGSLSGGMAVMIGIIITGAASGGHINPAVSVTMAVGGRLAWYELPAYLIAQVLGAGLGAVTVLLCYMDTLTTVSPAVLGSAPGLAQSILPLILDQFVATFLLLLCILSVTEQDQKPGCLLVGLSVFGIGMGYGGNAGAATNPALDAVPRLVGYIWSREVAGGYFWLVPVFVPYIGGIAALLTYRLVIGMKSTEDHLTNSTKAEQLMHQTKPEQLTNLEYL